MPTNVSDTNALILPTIKSIVSGLAGILTLQSKGASLIAELDLNLASGNTVIPAATGQSAGTTLPASSKVRIFVGYGSVVVATDAAWAALGSDALRDNANVLTDTIAPIGSMYWGLTVASAAVSGSKLWMKTAAATWTAIV
jgi:hypothetical protein